MAHGVTDFEGDYRIAVGEGYWNVFAVPYSLQDSGHSTPFASDNLVKVPRSSVEYNFQARPIEGYVYGNATAPNGDPIEKLELLAINMTEGSLELGFRNTDETDGYFSFGLGSGDWAIFADPLPAAERQLIFIDPPRFTIDPLLDDYEPPEIEIDYSTAEATSTIFLTISDPQANLLEGIRVHAYTEVGGIEYHSFGVSDENGIAPIAALDGEWHLHLSELNLRQAGFRAAAGIDITVAGGDASTSVQTEPFSEEIPPLALEIDPDSEVVKFKGIGDTGRRYRVEVSTDLKTWREGGRVISESDGLTISAPRLNDHGRGFVRLRKNED